MSYISKDLYTNSKSSHVSPGHDATSIVLDRWAHMFWLMSWSFLSTSLSVVNIGSRTFVVHPLNLHKIAGLPILSAVGWFTSFSLTILFLHLKSSSNSGMWNLYPCLGEDVVEVTDSCFGFFFTAFCILVFDCCFSPRLACLLSGCQSIHSRLKKKKNKTTGILCPILVQCSSSWFSHFIHLKSRAQTNSSKSVLLIL